MLLFISVYSSAQQVDLRWAEKIKTKKEIFVLGGTKNEYFTGHIDKDDRLVCRKYDKSMQMVKEQVVPFELDEKRYSYRKSFFINNKIVHLISENKRKEDKNVLYASFTDLNLKNSDKTLILDEADDDKSSLFGSNFISPDSTKILIFHEKIGKKKEPSTLSLKVYNSDFSDIIFDKLVQIPIKDKDFSTESISVDNLGNVYVLAKVLRNGKERGKGQSAYFYKLIVFERTTGSPKEFDFDFQDQAIGSIDIIPGKDNTLICTGFLSDIEDGFLSKKISRVSDELFTAIFDCNTLGLKSNFRTKTEGLYPEKAKSKDKIPYRIRDIFYKDNGGYVVVAEQYQLIITTHTTQYGTRTTYTYYYCDIACLHTDKEGKLESVTKVPKMQVNAGNPSIKSTFLNGKTYIVYEDLTKNLNATSDKETKRSSSSMFSSDSKNALFLLTVLPDGTPKKEILFDYKELKIKPSILQSRVIGPDMILLKANDQLGKIELH